MRKTSRFGKIVACVVLLTVIAVNAHPAEAFSASKIMGGVFNGYSGYHYASSVNEKLFADDDRLARVGSYAGGITTSLTVTSTLSQALATTGLGKIGIYIGTIALTAAVPIAGATAAGTATWGLVKLGQWAFR